MEKTDYEKVKQITEQQEELLRFRKFSNRDALDLGNFIVDRIREKKLELAVAIRRLNGAILFHHMTEGTNINNQNWMERKFNTVSLMERSSLGVWALSLITGETVAVHGLSEAEYVFVGGGFPIRLQTGEIAGVLTVSNLHHIEDHQFIVDSLSKWLNVREVPWLSEYMV